MGLLSVVALFFCMLAISSVCEQSSLSEADSQELLDAHNRFRSMHGGSSSNQHAQNGEYNMSLYKLYISASLQFYITNYVATLTEGTTSILYTQQWNDELAMVAQNYTEMCTFARNPQRADQAPSFDTVGENLFVTVLQNVNYTAFVQAWYDQNENYNFQFNNCSAACDEYRQVIHV